MHTAMNTETKIKTEITGETNADPISGEPGAHPVGTGVGAAVVGSAGLAIAASIAGPVGVAAATIGGAFRLRHLRQGRHRRGAGAGRTGRPAVSTYDLVIPAEREAREQGSRATTPGSRIFRRREIPG